MASQGKEGHGVSEQRIEFKVELMGDFEFGESQILTSREREPKTGTAFTVKYETQTLRIEKTSVKARIRGNIRQERYNVDSNEDYKDADGVILVYDITNHKSFERMTLCLQELHRHKKKSQAIILIGNKSDSENDRDVLRKEAHGFAKEKDLLFSEIPALEGTNLENALKELLTKLVNINSNNTTNNDNTTEGNNSNNAPICHNTNTNANQIVNNSISNSTVNINK